jgi:hypothetical protein
MIDSEEDDNEETPRIDVISTGKSITHNSVPLEEIKEDDEIEDISEQGFDEFFLR